MAWDTPSVRFTAAGGDGPHDIQCTVTDGRGCSNTGSLVLLVGTAIGLDLSTERMGVVAGGGAHRTGSRAPLTLRGGRHRMT